MDDGSELVAIGTRPLRRGLKRVRAALEQAAGILWVSGESGVGKTYLGLALPSVLRKRFEVARLRTPGEPEELAPAVAASLARVIGLTEGAGFEQVAQALVERDQSAVVILDLSRRADSCADQVLACLLALRSHALDAAQVQRVRFIALSRCELPPHTATNSPVTALELEPLHPDDVEGYIERRMSRVGFSGPLPFSGGAIDNIARRARGIPREINHICHRLYLAAVESDLDLIDELGVEACLERRSSDAAADPAQVLGRVQLVRRAHASETPDDPAPSDDPASLDEAAQTTVHEVSPQSEHSDSAVDPALVDARGAARQVESVTVGLDLESPDEQDASPGAPEGACIRVSREPRSLRSWGLAGAGALAVGLIVYLAVSAFGSGPAPSDALAPSGTGSADVATRADPPPRALGQLPRAPESISAEASPAMALHPAMRSNPPSSERAPVASAVALRPAAASDAIRGLESTVREDAAPQVGAAPRGDAGPRAAAALRGDSDPRVGGAPRGDSDLQVGPALRRDSDPQVDAPLRGDSDPRLATAQRGDSDPQASAALRRYDGPEVGTEPAAGRAPRTPQKPLSPATDAAIQPDRTEATLAAVQPPVKAPEPDFATIEPRPRGRELLYPERPASAFDAEMP